MPKLVARLALVTHMAFVWFALLGGFLAWLAPWVLIPHLASAAWGARIAVFRKHCPLTRLENWGRQQAGEQQLSSDGFVAHYFEGKVYPRGWARRVELLVGTVILGSWIGLSLR